MTQNGPSPDYRSDLPEDQLCGCEESEHLRAELGAAHVRIARQAAVIRRVRAHRADCPQWYTAEERLSFNAAVEKHLNALERAGDLAAAPETTAPEKLGQDVREMLAAANARIAAYKGVAKRKVRQAHNWYEAFGAASARVAELERDKVALLDSNRGLAGMVDAANARAEAAERQTRNVERGSENLLRRTQQAESEAAALRADVERLRQAPAPTEREAAERKVLEAVAQAYDEGLSLSIDVIGAELALREVKRG